MPAAEGAGAEPLRGGLWRARTEVQVYKTADCVGVEAASVLAPGSLVAELESREGLVRISLLEGQGPLDGWVRGEEREASLALQGTERVPTAPAATQAPRPVWIWAQGSRGDIQPLLALGAALQKKGLRTRLFANPNFRSFVESRGLLFTALGPDFQESFRQFMKSTGFKRARSVRETVDRLGEHHGDIWGNDFVRESSLTIAQALDKEEPQLVLFTANHGALPFLAWQRYGTPVCNVEFCPALRSAEELAGILDPFFTSQAEVVAGAVGVNPMEGCTLPKYLDWRKDHKVFVCPPSAVDSIFPFAATPFELLEGARGACKGFLVLDVLEQMADLGEFGGAEALQRLQRYLDAGAPPVFVGWGSMPMPVSVLAGLLAALKDLGRRAIVAKGWGTSTLEALREHLEDRGDPLMLADFAERAVLFIDAAPHAWLLPRCAGVVHHGGAGTTCATVRAGVPSIVTPYIVDQFLWAEWVCDNDVGLRVNIHQEHYDWARALERLFGDHDMRASAEAFGRKMRAEDGVGAMVSFVETAIQLSPNPQPPVTPRSSARFGW